MQVGEMVGHECAWWDYAAWGPGRDFTTADVAPEAGAGELNADAVAETEVDEWEFRLPGLNRDVGELVEEREGGVRGVFYAGGDYFGADFGEPGWGGGEVDEDPGCVYATVELACEDCSDNKLDFC